MAPLADVDELERLWTEHSGFLFGLATALSTEAEDVVMTVFTRLVKKPQDWDEIDNPRAYLARCVQREVFRQRAKHGSAAPSSFDVSLVAAPDADDADDRIALTEALASLPAEQREVIALHCWAGTSFKKIGEQLEMSRESARTRYNDAIDQLGRILGEQEDE